jgi:hypothetical protein
MRNWHRPPEELTPLLINLLAVSILWIFRVHIKVLRVVVLTLGSFSIACFTFFYRRARMELLVKQQRLILEFLEKEPIEKAERKRRPTIPLMNRVIDLAGLLFSEHVRDRIYTPYSEELKEDDLNARKRFRSPGARKWIKFCLCAKFAHLFVSCCGSAISKRALSALKVVVGQRLIEFLQDLVQSFR